MSRAISRCRRSSVEGSAQWRSSQATITGCAAAVAKGSWDTTLGGGTAAPVGEIECLQLRRLIDEATLSRAVKLQDSTQILLGKVLVTLGTITEEDFQTQKLEVLGFGPR